MGQSRNSTKVTGKSNGASNQESSLIRMYNVLRYHIIPPIFVVFFTIAAQVLAHQANPSVPFHWDRIWGNSFSWKAVAVFVVWAVFFLRIPSKTFKGPATSFGYVPVYSDNGFLYYSISIVTFLGLHKVYPDLSADIYDNMPYLLGSLNVLALGLCTGLWIMGKYAPQSNENLPRSPLMYEFYRGMEIHPRLFKVDVKQLTNCRIGMMLWQILILTFLLASWGRTGNLNIGHLTNVLLQSIYIAKFFWWETGYFNTLDITLDRAGYYICWGCLVWVPGFYTYSSYYLVAYQSQLTPTAATTVFILGLASIFMNYRVDYEKQIFRESDGRCNLWGRPARFLLVQVQSAKNDRQSKLLLSGCWGIARHLNYVFEIMAACLWCAPGFGHGVWPFLYAIFLTGLLIHRVFRDEEKCQQKYGSYWAKYCQLVPYRMIPYVF